MDTRNGDLYPSKAAALDAGVPEERIAEIVTIESGPFKGRQYFRNPDGSLGRRVTPGLIKHLKKQAAREDDRTAKQDFERVIDGKENGRR